MRTPEPPKDQIRQFATNNDELDELRASFDAARNGHGDRRRGRDRRRHPRESPDRRATAPDRQR